MKIGIDIRTLMDSQYSGVPEYSFNIINEILKLDSANKYKLFYNSGKDIKARMPKFEKENAVTVCTRYPNKIFNFFLQKIAKYPQIDRLLDVDLFFMPNLGFISLSNNCRKFITIHDLSFIRYPEFFSLKRLWWHKILGIKKMLHNFDNIIAVSENTKRDLIELLSIPEEKIKVIYSGINPCYKIISDIEQLTRIKQKYILPEKFIYYLGTMEPRKNIESLIKSYDNLVQEKDLKNYALVIAGARGWKNKSINTAWRNSKNKKNIKYLGYVDYEDKVYLYNLASVFVFCSYYEGFGFPPLEAMASGTPVVASNISSLPEVVRDGAIMVNPYNIAEITEAIKQIICNSKIQEKLRQKSQSLASEFSWQKSAEDYLKLFNN
jgi:glycosyltransferase involved in cell wall biosynthesis